MVLHVLFFVLATAFSSILFARVSGEQEPEYLIYNGREHFLYNNILDEYLKKYPEKRPKSPRWSTSMNRGYIATYEIKNNELLLKDIGINTGTTIFGGSILKSVLSEFLAGEQSVLKIDWFSGFLIVPENDRKNGRNAGDAPCTNSWMTGGGASSYYENYIIIEIKNGNFMKEMRMNCLEYRQFEQYKKRGATITNQETIDKWYEDRSWNKYNEQYPELIIYNTKEYILQNDLLYEYFKKHPEKLPKFSYRSKGLLRGYIGTFEIKNNELFLKDIGFQVNIKEYGEPVLKSVLSEFLAGQSALKIDWFSGFLIIPDGDAMKKYSPCVVSEMTGGGVTSYYENYILIEIKEGNFVREARMNCLEYRQFKNELLKEKEDYGYYNRIDEWGKLCEKRGGCASRKLK